MIRSLTDQQAIEAYHRIKQGSSVTAEAERLGVSYVTLTDVCKVRNAYRHLPMEPFKVPKKGRPNLKNRKPVLRKPCLRCGKELTSYYQRPTTGEYHNSYTRFHETKYCHDCKNDVLGEANRGKDRSTLVAKTREARAIKAVAKARQVHGDRFDYSLALEVYQKSIIPVPIICKRHGVKFLQDMSNHHAGKIGCPQCKKERKRSTEWKTERFLKRAREIHGDKFDYSRMYPHLCQNRKDPLTLTCPSHGQFTTTFADHLTAKESGCCPKCRSENRSRRVSHLEDKEIVRAYQLVLQGKTLQEAADLLREETGKEVGMQSVWRIVSGHTCKHLGMPKIDLSHRRGMKDILVKRCVDCGKVLTSLVYDSTNERWANSYCSFSKRQRCKPCWNKICGGANRDTLEGFIRKARKVHGNRYDYSQSVYVNQGTKIKIKCHLHGVFEQSPNDHLSRKSGCPTCGRRPNNWG